MGAHSSIMKVEELLEREELGLVRSPNSGRIVRRPNWRNSSEDFQQYASSPVAGSRVRIRTYAPSETLGHSRTRERGEGSRGEKALRRGHVWSGLGSLERLERARRTVKVNFCLYYVKHHFNRTAIVERTVLVHQHLIPRHAHKRCASSRAANS